MNDDDVDVVEALNERICLLQKVNETEHGYKLVIPMTEDSSCLSTHNIFTIRNKSLFLIRAYQIALEEMKVGVQWSRDCCQPAVDFGNQDNRISKDSWTMESGFSNA